MSGNNITWLAKSGGHGYAPSLHAIQDAVLINLELFNYVKLQDDNTAVVGTGVRFSDLIDTVAAAGRELSKPHQDENDMLLFSNSRDNSCGIMPMCGFYRRHVGRWPRSSSGPARLD